MRTAVSNLHLPNSTIPLLDSSSLPAAEDWALVRRSGVLRMTSIPTRISSRVFRLARKRSTDGVSGVAVITRMAGAHTT
jgi:hypothetical protein